VRAITIPEFGGPGVLTLGDVPEPAVTAEDVLIRVSGAGVNGADVSQRLGPYPPPEGAPQWLGLEASGTVEQVGSSVSWPAVGDRVCALLPGGGYAEKVAVHSSLVLPVPAGLSVLDAAALPEVAATVWWNVFMLGGLTPGQTLLVHGGSSGIGTMAIQLGLALGSRVIATAGTPRKVTFVESLGATGVNYREADFVEAVNTATGGAGANVVLDMVGGDYLDRNISALARDGRIMCIANRSRRPSTFSVGALMAKAGSIRAGTLRSRSLEERAAIVAAVRENVWPLVEDGTVRPVIDTVFDLADASTAHELMESSEHIGKILLRVEAETGTGLP
jgi:putative PIG3 family NAD(P)H quinone oxidoreductase